MLIPLGTDRPLRRPALVTPTLVAACGLIYILQAVLDAGAPPGEPPPFTAAFWVTDGPGLWYRAVTYAFLHGGLLHLLGNMLFLWVFGRAVEDKLGRIGFAAFYLGGAVFSGVMHAVFESGPAVGASGAIAAVTGAFLVLFPRTRIKVLWFFILITVVMAPAWFFIGLQIAWNLFAIATGGEGNVAVLAHLAGYSYGFLLALVLLSTKVLAREPYDLFTISRQAQRRRAFREASRVDVRPARPKPPREAERTEAVAEARAAVSRQLSSGHPEGAVAPYRALLDRYGGQREARTLARNAQYQLATHLYSVGEAELALRALRDFLAQFSTDREAPQMKVLLGRLLAARGEADEARAVLTEAAGELDDERIREIARQELNSLPRDGGRP